VSSANNGVANVSEPEKSGRAPIEAVQVGGDTTAVAELRTAMELSTQ
jgi:hypothetical protein